MEALGKGAIFDRDRKARSESVKLGQTFVGVGLAGSSQLNMRTTDSGPTWWK